ncbi:hypothetical protein ABW19_dt0203342 [Dactylella cylindrospora]|nr:hypothetical protein ABW19_dt0203342 [Dactylella cylindrospora]
MISSAIASSQEIIWHVALVALGAGAIWFILITIYRVYFHPLAHIPGPFLAKITDLYSAYYAFKGVNHYHLYQMHKRYGLMVRYGPNRVSFNSALAIKEIYGSTKPLKKAGGYKALILRGTADSTFSAIDKLRHGRKRRILGYGFSETALKSYEPIVQERIGKFCEILTKDSDNEGWSQARNMARLCSGLTFDVMAALVFGRPFRILEDEQGLSFVIDAINSGGKSTGVFLQLPTFGKNSLLFRFRGLFRLLFISPWDLKKIKNFLTLSAAMARERTERETAKLKREDIKVDGVPKRDIFSYILNAKDPETGEQLGPEEIWVEARVLIIAGSDTTSTAMSGALYYLSRNPEILSRLRAELHANFASEDDIQPGQQLNSCSYLKNFVEEVLRTAPPVGSALWRETTMDYAVEGQCLPKGTDVAVPIYAIHHNPEYFPEPHIFNPDRWNESIVGAEAVTAARSAWLPFQIGSRGCIGRPLAMLELNLMLAKVVYSYEFRVDEEKREIGEGQVDEGIAEFRTVDQLTALAVGPFLRFRKLERAA